MKKLFSVGIIVFLSLALAACSTTTESSFGDQTISIYTRDATSGTREAFFDKGLGDKEFALASTAAEVAANGDMLTRVASDTYAIGYASLDSNFTSSHKILSFEGVTPSEETVLDGSYAISRPFVLTTRADGDFASDDVQLLVAAFVDYALNSEEGLEATASAGGIVDTTNAKPWAELKTKYESVLSKDNSQVIIKTSGSTSVVKVLTALADAFTTEAGNVQIQQNQTGSGDGYKRVLGSEKDGANAADIGFASRNFNKDEDVSVALASGQMCMDAVVLIVNAENPLTNITKDQAISIFSGEKTKWSDFISE